MAPRYSNNVLVGIPLVSTLLGSESLVFVFAILVFHSLILFSLQSFYVALGSGERVSGAALLKNLANPLIVGLVAGALLNLSGLELPEPFWRLAGWLAQAALPCALLVLGAESGALSIAAKSGGVRAERDQAGAVSALGMVALGAAARAEHGGAQRAGANGGLPERGERAGVRSACRRHPAGWLGGVSLDRGRGGQSATLDASARRLTA